MNNKKLNKQSVISDEDIIELFWIRDENAIKETERKYKNYLFAIAYNIISDKEGSEECLNDTYLGAWNSIPPSRPNVLKAFLTVIMRRIAIKKYHSSMKNSSIPTQMTLSLSELEGYFRDSDDTEGEFEARELGRVLSEFVRKLSPCQQFIFMSRYYIADSILERFEISIIDYCEKK